MLKLSDFSKSFGRKVLFEKVSFTFYQNVTYYIYGENGIGKTTLFHCILGQEKFAGMIDKEASSIFCVFDDTPFFLNLTGVDNLVFFTKNKNIRFEIEKLESSYLSKGLLYKSRVRTYSLGERKMLALLLVRLLHPKILLLDEVLNGLDQMNRLLLLKTLKYLKKQGTLIIMSGHKSLYLELCDEHLWVKNKTIEVVPEHKVRTLFAVVEEGGSVAE